MNPVHLSAYDLADWLNLHRERTRKKLERYAEKFPYCAQEIEWREKDDPRFIYRVSNVIHLFKNARPAERARLKEYFSLPYAARCRENALWVLRLMESHGSIEFSRSFARRYAGAALYEFSKAFAGARDTEDLRFIEALIIHALERKM